MIAFVTTLTALLIIFAAGFGLVGFLLRDTRRVSTAELIVLSWLLGAAIVSLALWLLGTFLRGIPLQIAVTIVSLALALCGVVRWRKNKLSIRIPWPQGLLEWLLAVALGLEIALVVIVTFKHTLGWDGVLVWEMKARYAYLNGGALPAAYFHDATRSFSHPEYPLFLPMLEMWIYFWIGDCDQFWVKLLFPIFYAIGMLILAQAGAWWSGKRLVGLLAADLFLFIPALTAMAGGIAGGYADVPLSIIYLAAFYFLAVFVRENSKTALSIFMVLAALLPWMKREGIVLWFLLFGIGAVVIARRRGILPALMSILPGVCIVAIWKIYLHAMHASPPQDFLAVNFNTLWSNLDRLGPVLGSLVAETTDISLWNLLWFGMPIALICLALRYRAHQAGLLAICILAPVGLYCSTYVFSAWSDYLHHVHSSLPRLLLHVAPLSILAIALALTPKRETRG